MSQTCQGAYTCPGCPTCLPTPHQPLTRADENMILRALACDPLVYPRPLRLVGPEACDGSMVCQCDRCRQQRAVLIAAGPKRIVQPWHGRDAA